MKLGGLRSSCVGEGTKSLNGFFKLYKRHVKGTVTIFIIFTRHTDQEEFITRPLLALK